MPGARSPRQYCHSFANRQDRVRPLGCSTRHGCRPDRPGSLQEAADARNTHQGPSGGTQGALTRPVRPPGGREGVVWVGEVVWGCFVDRARVRARPTGRLARSGGQLDPLPSRFVCFVRRQAPFRVGCPQMRGGDLQGGPTRGGAAGGHRHDRAHFRQLWRALQCALAESSDSWEGVCCVKTMIRGFDTYHLMVRDDTTGW